MASNREEHARLLSLAVHEFRTPITVVAGYLRMLLKHHGDSLGEQQRRLLEEAEKSCGRLSGLVAELSEIAHLEDEQLTLGRQDAPIFRMLAEVAGGVHEGEDRGVSLRIIGGGTNEMVSGDPVRLRKALHAILTATLREHVQPGTVIVRAEAVPADAMSGNGASREAVPASAAPGSALIVMGDPDAGSPAYRFDAGAWGAFQEFRGGVGFILPMARRVIEAMGGRIWSRSDSERRAAIALILPLKERVG
jgi:signal transduction histidine kinase